MKTLKLSLLVALFAVAGNVFAAPGAAANPAPAAGNAAVDAKAAAAAAAANPAPANPVPAGQAGAVPPVAPQQVVPPAPAKPAVTVKELNDLEDAIGVAAKPARDAYEAKAKDAGFFKSNWAYAMNHKKCIGITTLVLASAVGAGYFWGKSAEAKAEEAESLPA